MNKTVIRALIFDLDGTLVHSLPGIANALNLALADFNLPPHPEATVKGFIGNGAAKLAQRGLPETHKDQEQELLARFMRHYQDTWQAGSPPFPGIMNLLLDLQEQQYPMAVFSNKMHHNTVEIVRQLFPEGLFHPILGQREHIPIKPDPSVALEIIKDWGLTPEEVAYVGDSTVDLATARNAGMIPLIFSWGYGTPTDISLLHSCDDLRAALAQETTLNECGS